MNELPPFFKQYLEEKFDGLHKKIDANMQSHTNEANNLKQDIKSLQIKTARQGNKIWFATGSIAVLGLAGGIFMMYFKTLNKQQIDEVLTGKQGQIADQVVQTIENKYDLQVVRK